MSPVCGVKTVLIDFNAQVGLKGIFVHFSDSSAFTTILSQMV